MGDTTKTSNIDIVPQNGHVLCKQISGDTEKVEDIFLYTEKRLPVYQVLKISNPPSLSGISDDLNLKVGDKIVCNSTGTKVQRSSDEVLYLFKQENIAAKIKD